MARATDAGMQAILAQVSPVPGDPPRNAGRAAAIINTHAGADLVVLPELFLSGYDLAGARRTAVHADGPELAIVRQAAAHARTAVLVGFGENRTTGVANALACIDAEGELAAVYRKVFLFGHEAEVFEAGNDLVLAELGGRRVGPLICFDMEFPEPARALACAGADLLVTIAANMEPFYSDHLIASQARALDNRLPHLYVNRVGQEGPLEFVGGTRALRSDGTIHAAADGPAEVELTVDVGAPGAHDDRVDYVAQLPRELKVKATATTQGASR